MRIFDPPATFEVTPLGDTPQAGFKVSCGRVRKFVGPSDGAPFDAFQLVCFGMVVREVLGA